MLCVTSSRALAQLFVYKWRDGVLKPCAFYDAYVQSVSINVVKDYILMGDVFKSVHFLRWKVRYWCGP